MAGARVDRANTDWPGLPLGVDRAWEIHSGCFPTPGCAIRDWKQQVLPTREICLLSPPCPGVPVPAGNGLAFPGQVTGGPPGVWTLPPPLQFPVVLLPDSIPLLRLQSHTAAADPLVLEL